MVSSIVNVRQQKLDLPTYIGPFSPLKEKFLSLMPLTTDIGTQQSQVDKFFMVLMSI